MRTHRRIIIAHHLIFYAYGQWLPNDPRGSGSDHLRQPRFDHLGPIHFGRKPVQPPRKEVRAFYEQAGPKLECSTLWFDDMAREMICGAFSQVAAANRYIVWACAILRNHAHLCVRRHRDDGQGIWRAFATAAAEELRRLPGVEDGHPVWANRPYAVFLYSPEDIRRVIAYVERNPGKEGLPPQRYPFVVPYDGWPHPRKDGRG